MDARSPARRSGASYLALILSSPLWSGWAVRFTKDLGGYAIGFDCGRHAAIHCNEQQYVLHLLLRASIGQRALCMNTEFRRPITRGGYSEHHEAANVIGEARSFPDIPVNVGIDDV